MLEGLNVLADITSAVISTIVAIPLESGSSLIKRKIEKRTLKKKIRKRAEFLKQKYKDNFERLDKKNKGSLYAWLKEERTIKRILSFCNAEDTDNISKEQMQNCKESFFKDAFNMAQIYDSNEKEELRVVLNDLFQYVDDLFWKALDEKDVFFYKKFLSETRRSTSAIIQEMQYHGSFAEYIDNQKVLQEVPFKLDYRSGKIPFVGRESEFEEIDAFRASNEQVSWWAVIGKGGSGKSRLVYEYIKKNLDLPDWKMCFLHDDFFNRLDGKYKNWNIWTYDKNLLLVVDYVQRYAKEVAQWIELLSRNNSIKKKIRILLLERTDGEKSLWIREGFETSVLAELNYGKDKKGFLQLQPLENDLIQFAMKYAEKNKKQISEADAIDAWNKLKTIDPDTRILYFIMILEAIFNNGPWRNWNRNDLAGYIVQREQEDIAIRFENNNDMIRSFNKLLAFCTATKELPIFELPQSLPEFIKNEVKEISNNARDKHELCALMQLEDGILQPFTPDIIGEYMVLYIIDQYILDQKEKEQFIRNLWIYDSDNFIFFVYRLLEDKMDDESYNDITKLMLFDAIPYDNIYVIEKYSQLMYGLIAIGDLNQILIYVQTLKKLYHNNPLDKIICYSYAYGLFNLSCKQEMPGRKETTEKLAQLASENAGNEEIQTTYAMGLFNLSNKQELAERKETMGKLAQLASENAGNGEIQTTYAKGLVNLSSKQELPEIKETIGKLAQLASENAGNEGIQTEYAKGLFNLSSKQELPEIKETAGKLAQLASENAGNGEIQTAYAKGLVNLSNKQGLPERKETTGKLAQLASENAGSGEIQTAYAMGLVNLSCEQGLP
ncbi:MAG: hypothetical protein HDR08_12790, partial [Lachnospiraceae bacterium]|nr:hypothetical protein [Lachnospiraceae bacterium]